METKEHMIGLMQERIETARFEIETLIDYHVETFNHVPPYTTDMLNQLGYLTGFLDATKHHIRTTNSANEITKEK